MGGPGVLRMGDGVKLYTAHEYWLICPTHVLFKMNREVCEHKQCLTCTLHAGRPPQLWRYSGSLTRALRHVDCLLTPSKFALAKHRSEGIDCRMMHLPHFVPAMPPAAPAPSDAPLPSRPFFIYVGRLEKLKGAQDLVRIFGRYREADLLLVGQGGYEDVLKQEARDLPHVKFLGSLHPTKLSALYQAATAVLVPSICYETFGLTAAEALMNGTPAIVRKIGALTEIVEQSGGGYTFSTDEQCIAAMEELRGNPALRREMGQRGQSAARELWSTEAHLGRYLRLAESLLDQQSPLEEPDLVALSS